MRRLIRLPAAAVALALLFAACGGDDKDDKAADTTSSTTATTAGSTTSTTVSLKSDSPVAAALDATIISGSELQAALGLSAAPGPYQGLNGNPPPPQGPISFNGIVKVFPSEAYAGPLEQGGATVGANKSYLVPSGSAGYVVNVLAIKFKDAAGGQTFVTSSTSIATTFGNAKTNPHSELKVGLLPGAVLVVPPQAPSTSETVVAAALYQDGVYYLVSTSAPPAAVKDEVVIKILKAQDTKYQSKKSSIPSS